MCVLVALKEVNILLVLSLGMFSQAFYPHTQKQTKKNYAIITAYTASILKIQTFLSFKVRNL